MTPSIEMGAFPPDLLAQLKPEEAAHVAEVAGRDETASFIVQGDGGKLIGYAVFGYDASDMVTIFAARSVNSILARAALMGIFGAAQVLGQPLRVHTEKLRAMARMMGAEKAMACLDGDGLPMGVFGGV